MPVSRKNSSNSRRSSHYLFEKENNKSRKPQKAKFNRDLLYDEGNTDFARRMINKILYQAPGIMLLVGEIQLICSLVTEILFKEHQLLTISKNQFPLYVFGDIHGQLLELRHILNYIGSPENKSYLFLGDYVDRGKQSIEVICLLYCLKIVYPKNVHLLRGNHEDPEINVKYGFYQECCQKYNVQVFETITDTYRYLSISASIDNIILCMHGGLSPELINLSDINRLQKPLNNVRSGLACDLLWSDPDERTQTWKNSPRGLGFLFGKHQIDRFCMHNNVHLIIRAHQQSNEMVNGYKFFSKVLTVFSAYNYNGKDNAGSVLELSFNHSRIHGSLLTFKSRTPSDYPQIYETGHFLL